MSFYYRFNYIPVIYYNVKLWHNSLILYIKIYSVVLIVVKCKFNRRRVICKVSQAKHTCVRYRHGTHIWVRSVLETINKNKFEIIRNFLQNYCCFFSRRTSNNNYCSTTLSYEIFLCIFIFKSNLHIICNLQFSFLESVYLEV